MSEDGIPMFFGLDAISLVLLTAVYVLWREYKR